MNYALVLQTISTLTGLAGVGCVLYATFVARRLHSAVTEVPKAVAEQTADLKRSIEEQTSALAPPPKT
jgi:hypothetical protein